MIEAGRLSALIGLIYDCAIDPAGWGVALEAIRIEVGGANASLDLLSVADGATLLNVMSNIPAPWCDTMSHYSPQTVDLWGGYGKVSAMPLDRPLTLLRQRPDFHQIDLTLRTEWAKPQGISDVLGIWLARDAATFGVIGFGRFERDGPYGDRELAIAELLVPHLQRAATINRLLDIAALERANFAALFDALTVPVLLVDGAMRLVHGNASGHNLLARATPLHIRSGALCATDLGTNHALRAAVAQAVEDRGALGRKGLGIPLRLAHDSVGALHVLPLAPGHTLGRSGALAAVFVARSLTPLVAPTQVFAALFGLTPGEGRVFDHIAAGRSVTQTAEALGVEGSTVKTHLLRLYDKTGVRRQAELVHMAASLAVPVMQQPVSH